MSLITYEKLAQVQGVAEGSTFTVDVPTGFTYHSFHFTMGGTTFDEGDILNLKLWVNGKVVQHFRTGTELDNLNQFDNLAAVANDILRWDMTRIGLDLVDARERTALGTGIDESIRAQLQNEDHVLHDPVQVTSVQITGELSGTTAPTLEVWARRSAPRPTNVVTQVRNFDRSITGSGEYEISDLPKNQQLSRVLFKDAGGAGDISSVELKINNISIFKRTAAQNTQVQNDGVRTAQAGYFIYDPAEDGQGNNAPPIGADDDVRWIVTTTGAVTLEITYCTIGYLNQ